MKNNLRWLVAGVCVVCASRNPAIGAQYQQRVRCNTPTETTESQPALPDAIRLNKTTVLARNTNLKATSAAPATTAKSPQAPAEKKTVGRYWRRLMTMVREINQSRHAKR